VDYEENRDDEHHRGGDSTPRGHEGYPVSSEVVTLHPNQAEICVELGKMMGVEGKCRADRGSTCVL